MNINGLNDLPSLDLTLISEFLTSVDENLRHFSPYSLIAMTAVATYAIQSGYQLYKDWDTRRVKSRLIDQALLFLQRVPYIGQKVRNKIDQKVSPTLDEIRVKMSQDMRNWPFMEQLPETGLSEEKIRELLQEMDDQTENCKSSGAVYAKYSEALKQLLQYVWLKSALTNSLHTKWPIINAMHKEVISWCHQLTHSVSGSPGLITHGGTTSILEACKAYVLHAKEVMGIASPEVIVPESAHVAFDKAAEIEGVKLIKVPVDEMTGAADVKQMAHAMTSRTCLLVGSAPSYPFGVFDPIESIANLAKRNGVGMHVDACLGGFLNAFSEEAGFELPAWDFAVDGVTSLSMDTHKYGLTPKGTSVLLFSKNAQVTTVHTHLDWVGGMYVTPGIDGSRSGADIATTWTILAYNGKETYVQQAKAIFELRQRLVEAINALDGVFVPYNPQHAVVGIQTQSGINSLLVAEKFQEKDWSVQIMQTPDQKPAGFHFCLTSLHTEQPNFVEAFVSDLNDAVKYAQAHPNEKPKGMAKAYGKLEKGVPHMVQRKIGEGYAGIWFWEKPGSPVSRSDNVVYNDEAVTPN